jgi:toxin ParE1/3/4
VRVRWLRAAVANLITETECIARDNPGAAARVEANIKRDVEELRRFPSLGRPGRVAGTRELVIPGTPYIIPYRVRDDTIQIMRVFHAARRWPEMF